MKVYLKKLTISGISLALCLLLPFLTGQVPYIGNMLSPMHIPVLICGMICGWPYGFSVGLIAPVLRFFLLGSPPLLPIGLAMTFELAAYGAAAGILYRIMYKNIINLYISLLVSMLFGRIVWGIAMLVITGLSNTQFTFDMFLTSAFITALPGIILHIIVVPAVVMALSKVDLYSNE